ncbi:MAG: alpha/beta hydrolase, partial [Candidatus Hodarchaeota archaeon]
ITYAITLFLANYPRMPVDEKPDWGEWKEFKIPTYNNKKLECWVVYPEKINPVENDEKAAIILIHGWGRNRGRMVSRARIYGRNGYITILISARDHGNSDKERLGMSIIRFSQDVEACLKWWGKKAIIVGHSIGAGASIIVAAKNSDLVKAVIAESTPYAFPYSLKYVYHPALRWFTPIFLPGIIIITLLKVRNHSKKDYSPLEAASKLKCPVLLIHGKNDQIFPYKYVKLLEKAIGDHCKSWIPDNADHHNIENHPEYEQTVIEFINASIS